MCRYMWLPIAFRDNQQISLADSTRFPLNTHQDQKIQEEKDEKHLGQMKSLALPFQQNPTLEAVFSEV